MERFFFQLLLKIGTGELLLSGEKADLPVH